MSKPTAPDEVEAVKPHSDESTSADESEVTATSDKPHHQLVEANLEQPVTEQPQNPVDYPSWLSTFKRWLGDTSTNERKNLLEFFDRSKQWWNAASELTADEFSQASNYFKRDLMMFYRHYQHDLEQSEYFQSLKESMWQELADLTDKSQIEWQELKKDFEHDGVYHAGEWIGMGNIVCKSCHYRMEFVHPETLSACPECNGTTFLREALAP